MGPHGSPLLPRPAWWPLWPLRSAASSSPEGSHPCSLKTQGLGARGDSPPALWAQLTTGLAASMESPEPFHMQALPGDTSPVQTGWPRVEPWRARATPRLTYVGRLRYHELAVVDPAEGDVGVVPHGHDEDFLGEQRGCVGAERPLPGPAQGCILTTSKDTLAAGLLSACRDRRKGTSWGPC